MHQNKGHAPTINMQAESAKTGRLFRLAGHLRGTEERGPGDRGKGAGEGCGDSSVGGGYVGQGDQCQPLGTADAGRGEIRW